MPVNAEDQAARAFLCTRSPETGWLLSLQRAEDPGRVEFIRPGQTLGPVKLRVGTPGASWRDASQGDSGVEIRSRFVPRGETLRWEITVKNTDSGKALEIGDLALPLPMNADYVADSEETFLRRVFRHAYIAGNGSFLYWLPVQGSGSFLVMRPEDNTQLEFFTSEGMDYATGKDKYSVFVHSKASSESDPRGTWHQPQTNRLLKPGEEVGYAFGFHWTDSYDGVRDIIYQNGGVDLHVAPGMVVPRDLEARVALHTKQKISGIEAGFPQETAIEPVSGGGKDMHIFRVKFKRPGENLITVRYAAGHTLPLEFFVTEPLETLIKKRAAFIVKNQQHRNPEKWYDGLYSLWDRRQPEGMNLLGPDNPGGQPPYAVSGSDDPSNSKCLLVAEKNVAFPDAGEVASLEYFIKHFVWGKHQRTDKETPYPYGIYGSDSWKENRFTGRDPLDKGISRPGGPSACKMWRTFDYTTYFALYYDMYRIAKQRPDLVKELDAAGYLERAYGTARAFFEVPANIHMEGGWSFTGWVDWQYKQGNFHEKYLLPLISSLEAEGQQTKADFLRAEWEKKVKYFCYDNPHPFASEMPIDSTAYESTYAAAKYALDVGLRPDTNLWQDRNSKQWFSHPVIDPKRHQEFLLRQHLANLACRGVLETNYWSLGSDFRGCGSASYTLSYMSQMGGWAVLDYALHFDPHPAANLRLGYASMLSTWALMNTGDAQSGYGFWTPGARHDGAMSWGFQPRRVGTEWNPATRDLPRGAWPVDGEVDHGLAAAIETARTVLFDDPIFGVFAYGGEAVRKGESIEVIPRDGVRQRFSAVIGAKRLHLDLDCDGFAQSKSLQVAASLDRIRFTLENRGTSAHNTRLRVEGLPQGNFTLIVNNENKTATQFSGGAPVVLSIPLATGLTRNVEIKHTELK